MRPTRPQMFMEIAHVVAKRSTCMRLNVGAVIVQDRRIVSIGYNGAPSGAPHCAGNDCPGKHHCHETIHAEDNALRHLPAGLRIVNNQVVDLDLYVTDSPCASCFQKIKDHGGIRRVFFANPYRITDHLMSDAGVCNNYCPETQMSGDCFYCGHTARAHYEKIGIYKVTPAGYIVDWNTKELVDVET